ncbi:receptor like protein 22-like [Nicotiana tabacum]|uniref:receptor like protein 22-like n=1 Tax=Nicotiana tabacum TaxID=4097 RepID=UPI003F4ED0AE
MRSQMFSQLVLILLLSICCRMNEVVAANSGKCLQDQKTLLLQLRNNLTYDSEISTKLVKWNQRIDCCRWQGITCNGAGQVIGLDLTDELFSGSIHPLANLKFLSVIRVDGNNLSAPIPEFFLDLSNLTVLSLRSCNLIGEAPQKIFQVPTLQTIDLSQNEMLGGSLPEFPSNGSLQTLVLSNTGFSGSIPTSIENLSILAHVDLSLCNFTGPIPSSMVNLTKLVYLDFDRNSFTGSFPSFKLSKNLSYINSAGNYLTGISSDWEGFENLEGLDLSNNSISGHIPASLFYLPSLSGLDLSINKFSGQITELQNVTSPLTDLDLSANKLEGPIPEFFFELHDLLDLKLSSNNFNGTVQFKKFTELNKLVNLDLSHNSLSVDTNISESELSLLPQLNSLMMGSCNLQNLSFLKNQSRLSMLDLSNNKLTGEIPNWLVEINDRLLRFLNLSVNQFTHFQEPYRFGLLNFLDLHSNLLTGVIPLPPRAAAYIDFSNNNLATMIPPDFGNYLVTAWFLSIANNKVIGNIPSSICNARYLEVLDLSNNTLNGTIPPCLAEKSNTLKVLNLRKNNLTGNIPREFSHNCQLQTLDLSQNYLTGELPRSLSNCTNLKLINLGNNKIKDTFPCWLRNLSNLRVLALRFNGFHGDIECSRGSSNWTALQIIDLASNNLGGILPPNSFLELNAMTVDPAIAHSRFDHLYFESVSVRPIYYQDTVGLFLKGQNVTLEKIPVFFTSIDFSSNNFVGDIPETVGDLKSLYLLNISHNNLTGQIPPAFGNLKQLGSLDLSFNKLDGNIPEKLASLTFLSFLNLSYNELVGMIPRSTQFDTFAESFIGNKGLCGFLLNITCKNDSAVAPSEPEFEEEKLFSSTEIYVSIILGFVVGIGIIVLPLLFSKRWNHLYNKLVDRLILRIFQQQDQDGRTSISISEASRKKAARKSRGSH